MIHREHIEHAETDKSAALDLFEKDKSKYYRQIIDLVHSAAMHYIEAMLAKENIHVQKHSRIPRVLRGREENELADIFEEIETMRGVRKYGKAENGVQAQKALDLLEKVKEKTR